MTQPSASLSVQPSNTRIRVVASHVVHGALDEQKKRLDALVTDGTVIETRSREWRDGAYRFGADWLTPQAIDLLGLLESGPPSIVQYEVSDRNFGILSLPGPLAFRAGGRDRATADADPAVAVTLHKCGAVLTAVDIVLVWVELSIDSDEPATWIDLTRAIRHRVRPGDKADYLRRFVATDGSRLTVSDILLPTEIFFIGKAAEEGAHAAKNLFTFGRYKLLTDAPEAVAMFMRKIGRKTADPRGRSSIEGDATMSARQVGEEDEAAILDVCSVDSLTIALWQLPEERQPVGAAAFQNAFHLGDLWLSFVVCVVQFQKLVSLEREMLDVAGNLDRIGKLPHWSPQRVRDIAAVQNRYKSVMSSFIQGYWRFGLLQIHSHDRRHRVYARLREEMSLDRSLADFHQKLETLGNYVEEKQRDFLNWVLVYVPFVSFLVGVFGINVKGWTSQEGMRPETLMGTFLTLTAIYAACVMTGRYLLRDRQRRRSG